MRDSGLEAVYAQRFRGKRREWIWSFKKRPCEDCGVTYPPYVMQFDHRDPAEKKFNLSTGEKHTRQEVLAEIAKCDVVCANCHAARTFERMLQAKIEGWRKDVDDGA